MTRRPISTTKRQRIWDTAEGRCHICDEPIKPGEKWDVEHRIPFAMGGADDESNLSPAHVACHGIKTKCDLTRLAKIKRIRARHTGAKRSSWPKSKWRRKVNGTVELR